MVFSGNDRPGVMLADAVRRYAENWGVACGRAVCVFANNDSAYSIAGALHQRDVKVTAVVDLRNDVSKECTAIVKEIGCGYSRVLQFVRLPDATQLHRFRYLR